MSDHDATSPDATNEAREALLNAALPHVAFDGWTRAAFDAAAADSGMEPAAARAACPRGGVDLAAAFHRRGDAALTAEGLEDLRYSEKVAALVRRRIELVAGEREAVRRGVTLFSLPQNSVEGAKLIWGTADRIWTLLGDTSDDFNWYSKRTILSGVYSSTILFWLGDQSDGSEATWSFLDRRIEDVMRFEKTKARLKQNPLARAVLAGPMAVLSRVRAPGRRGEPGFPLPGGRTGS